MTSTHSPTETEKARLKRVNKLARTINMEVTFEKADERSLLKREHYCLHRNGFFGGDICTVYYGLDEIEGFLTRYKREMEAQS